jgi:hypothetical protein
MGFLELLMLAMLTSFGFVGVAVISFVVWFAGKPEKDFSTYVSKKSGNYNA